MITFSLNVTDYSKIVWNRLLGKNQISSLPGKWPYEIYWAIKNCGSKSFRNSIFKLYLAAAIYYLWDETNARIVRQKARDAQSVLVNIENDIKDSVCTWKKVKNTQDNWMVCLSWNMPTGHPDVEFIKH